jgi:subtilisin-like proprotein convertase family protein
MRCQTTEPSATRRIVAGGLCAVLIVVLVAGIVPPRARAATFSNPTPITISDYDLLFSPYPSRIEVSGLTGTITDVNVTLHDFTHAQLADVDIVLVGPAGTGYAVLMADIYRFYTAHAELTFDDTASSSLCVFDPRPLGSGTYRPSLCGSYTIDPALTNAALSVFKGESANGTWELYGGDDTGGEGGAITGGWSLEITTNGPTISTFGPASGPAGTSVAIEGTRFTRATSVTFGGTAATTFSVVSGTLITATVPDGAATGPIAVTTPNGTATSATGFTVTTGTPTPTDHARKVSLALRRQKARGTVRVADGFAGCADGVRVKLQRRHGGRWRAAGSATTTTEGRFVVPVHRPGIYRAVAKRVTLDSGDVCLRDVSPRARLERP